MTAARPPRRAVVVVDDGAAIRIVAYQDADAVASVDLTPLRALDVAAELIAAALRRLR